MGCQFSSEDLQAVQQGYALRDALTNRLDTDLTPPSNFVQLKHFEILGWLIQNEYLDLRIAIPLKPSGQLDSSDQVLDPQHLFHKKVGIISDANGNCLAFNGSNNESLGGWQNNVESFQVYFSWYGGTDLQRIHHESDKDIGQDARPTDDIKNIVGQASSLSISEHPEQIQKEREQFSQLANIHNNEGCLDFSVKSIPVKPWAHQMKILRRMAAEFPRNALIADEVGLGKTIETGLVLRYLLLSKKVKRVLILVPASVQPQWQEEMREKFNLHFWFYGKNELIDPYKQAVTITGNPWNQQNLVLASSHLVRRKERMQELLESDPIRTRQQA